MSILLWHNPPPFGLRIQSCASRALDKVYCQRNKCGNIRGRVVPIQVAMGQLHHKCHHSHLKNMINVLKNCKTWSSHQTSARCQKSFPLVVECWDFILGEDDDLFPNQSSLFEYFIQMGSGVGIRCSAGLGKYS